MTRESDIEKALVEGVKKLGGFCRKVKWGCRRGCPDRLVIFRNKGDSFVCWVELKASPTSKLTIQQKIEINDLRYFHQNVFILDTLVAVENLLAYWKDHLI